MWSEALPPGQVLGGQGALGSLEQNLPPAWRGQRGLLVADAAVADRLGVVERPLAAAGSRVARLVLAGGEASKTWAGVEKIVEAALDHGVRRQGFLVAVGGGALTDVAGFAAAIYLRGVPWAAVPTTLLGQVDAAIGGKTAIDGPHGKNLVGAFHPPLLVLADPWWLDTLPAREWRSGVGEVAKAALLLGGEAWAALAALPAPPAGRAGAADLADAAAHHKVRVAAADPLERQPGGGRATLNLGHTLGHALEAAAGMGPLAHGEAVGIGLLAACFVSEAMLGLDPAVQAGVRAFLRRWDMPTAAPELDARAVRAFLAKDKKATAEGLRWVLLAAPGEPRMSAVPPALVDEALARALDPAAP